MSDDSGQPGPKTRIHLEDVLEVFDERDDLAEPLTSKDVAEELNCSPKTAYRKLDQLVIDEKLRSKKAGSRSKVYWTPIYPQFEDR